MKRLLVLIFACFAYLVFSSHELFLKSDAYFLKPFQASELYLTNGTFDKSENSITLDRIQDARFIGNESEEMITDEQYYLKDDKTYIKFKAGESSTYVAGISTLPRMIEMEAEAFNNYLDHEGLEDTIKERKNDKSYSSGAREKYSKHVKMLFQVGDKTTDDYKTVLNYPIEFVPLNNPYDAGVNKEISFKLYSKGRPLTNHVVHYSTSEPGKDAHDFENSTRTDKEGILTMTPNKAGKWYVATIHILKSDEEDVDYESNWATLSFAVK